MQYDLFDRRPNPRLSKKRKFDAESEPWSKEQVWSFLSDAQRQAWEITESSGLIEPFAYVIDSREFGPAGKVMVQIQYYVPDESKIGLVTRRERQDIGFTDVAHRSARTPGVWQLSQLDPHGTPIGHREYDTLEEALNDRLDTDLITSILLPGGRQPNPLVVPIAQIVAGGAAVISSIKELL